MAWNPSPEVAVARDAAQRLGAQQVVIVYVLDGGRSLGMASFGKTRELCREAGKLGDELYDAAMRHLSDR